MISIAHYKKDMHLILKRTDPSLVNIRGAVAWRQSNVPEMNSRGTPSYPSESAKSNGICSQRIRGIRKTDGVSSGARVRGDNDRSLLVVHLSSWGRTSDTQNGMTTGIPP